MTTRAHRGEEEDSSVADALERVCMRNLFGVREERFFFKDISSRFVYVSEGWLAAVGRGLTLQAVLGKTDFDFFTDPHASEAMEDEQRILRTGEPMLGKIERETFRDHPDGWVATSKWPLLDEAGKIIGTFGVSRNVTAEMQDVATGVANRLALMDRLRQALLALERQPGVIAVLFIDIDGFKQVNDTWGHRAGDGVLAEVARRLTGVSRRFDTVARYGGDEFVMLVTALHDEEDLMLIGERVMAALCQRLPLGDGSVVLTASIGAVLVSDPLSDPDSLLEHGDTAMYAAKRQGGGRLVVYDPEVHRPLGRVEPV